MGDVTRKPVIIEFNGLPGSGKTTVADYLQQIIEQNGFPTERVYYRRITHCNNYEIVLEPRYWRIIIQSFRYSRTFKTKKEIARVLAIARFIRMYSDFYCNRNGVLLMDQGVIQALISLAHEERMIPSREFSNLIKVCELEKLPIAVINCNLSPSNSNNRIELRHPNSSRLQQMSLVDRQEILSSQFDNLVFIRSLIGKAHPTIIQIDLDTKVAPKENARIVFDSVFKYMH